MFLWGKQSTWDHLCSQAAIRKAVDTSDRKSNQTPKETYSICPGCTCEGALCMGYPYTVTQKDVLYALQHKDVAQAVWKPEKYKETSHTTCCHYDNQAESFSLISCHSTQHRNPIAFKSYATRPPIRSARLLTHLWIRFIGAYMDSSGYL